MFNDIVAFLSPLLTREDKREATLQTAFYNQEALLNKVNYSGSAAVFVPRLIRVLQHHGEVVPGTQALWQLLLSVSEGRGPSVQQEIDDFRPWANARHEVTLLPDDVKGGTVINNNQRISIGGSVTGGNVNIGGTQTFNGNVTIGQTVQKGTAALSDKQMLQTLQDVLNAALASGPSPYQEAVKLVSTRAQALIQESNQADLDTETVMIKANRLKDASRALEAGQPHIASAGKRIAGLVLKMIGLSEG